MSTAHPFETAAGKAYLMGAPSGDGYTPFESQIRLKKHWTVPVYKKDSTEIEREEEWVEYELTSISSNGGVSIPARLSDIMDVGRNDDPGHAPTNILKARRNSIIEQLKRLKNGGSAMPDGHFPLEAWGGIPPAIVDYLKAAHNIHSVQQLRDCNESDLAKMPPSINPHRLQETARVFVDARASANAGELVKANTEKMQAMEDELAAMKDLVQQLLADRADDGPRKRGRPPNSEAA